jgi:two-component system, chemotaxis family, protein-glutamate methylesterase/glutaminase
MNEPLRVLIVDDSALVRGVLRELLESDHEIVVAGEAANGREALLRAAELRPDIITMDVRMPVMDGLETTEQLMAYTPTPILAITALFSRDDVDISFKMLGAGALEVMEKPDLSNPTEIARARQELIRRVKLLARVKVVTHLRGRRRVEPTEEPEPWRVRRTREPVAAPGASEPRELPAPPQQQKVDRQEPVSCPPSSTPPRKQTHPPEPEPRRAEGRMEGRMVVAPRPAPATFPVVVIGASTGGPRVVQQIVKGLPRSPGGAVLVVQHIAEGFSAGMVEWLDNTCSMPVRLAREKDRIEIDTVLVAPDGYHLFVQHRGIVHLDDQPEGQRPSVDITMQTAAEVFGSRTIGVLLTGMGRDGALGMQAIHQAGGYTIAQNEATCSIYGMPRAAVELNVVKTVLPPEDIIFVILERIKEKEKEAQNSA